MDYLLKLLLHFFLRNPNLLPIILITFAANIAKIAIPTIESAIGKVAKDFMLLSYHQ